MEGNLPMDSIVQTTINEFVMMWVLIDPIGTVPVFLAVTAGIATADRNALAVRATIIAAVVLFFFIVAGQVLLKALGIPLTTFQIAGGIVLFLFALTMIFGPPKSEIEKHQTEQASQESLNSIAVYPLAIPAIAGPGAMLGAVLLTDTTHFDPVEYALSFGVTATVLGISLLLLFAAGPIIRVIGDSGASVLSRIMGLILAAVAVDNVLEAVASYFHIPGIAPSSLL